MIMPDKPNKNLSKLFTKILNAAEKHWGEINRNHSHKRATGILEKLRDDEVRTAELSLSEQSDRIYLTVRLHINKQLTEPVIDSFLRFQNSLVNTSASVSIDSENNIANLRNILPVYEGDPEATINPLFEDTRCVLEDQRLRQIIN